MIDDTTELRCKTCGGPLEGSGDMLKCRYCGMMQLRIDAQRYIEQAKMEMMAWISKTMPAGVNLGQTENMDPIARHNIFMNSVRPTVDAAGREYRFGFASALANQLIALPFRIIRGRGSRYEPKELFEFNARMRSLSTLAVDDTSRSLLRTTESISTSYALILNNIILLEDNGQDRYQLMSNNFAAASEALEGLEGYEIPRKRFDALRRACDGIDSMLRGEIATALPELTDSKNMIDATLKEAYGSIDFQSMIHAMKRESVVCDTSARIASSLATGSDTSGIFGAISSLMAELDRESATGGSNLSSCSTSERASEILKNFSAIMDARNGGSVMIVQAPGNMLIPFWTAEIRYSFVTGSMFKKHSVEVSELVLLSASFPTSPKTLSDPSEAVTDIFSSMPDSSLIQRVKGNETTISMGGKIRQICDSSRRMKIPNAVKAVIPTSTPQEAEVAMNKYLSACKASHPKLQMGRAVIRGIVYIPAERSSGGLRLSVGMDGLEPRSLGSTETIYKLMI